MASGGKVAGWHGQRKVVGPDNNGTSIIINRRYFKALKNVMLIKIMWELRMVTKD